MAKALGANGEVRIPVGLSYFLAILITLAVRDTNTSIFCYHSITISLISIKPQKVEVQCLSYPLVNFQLLILPYRYNNIIGVIVVKNHL